MTSRWRIATVGALLLGAVGWSQRWASRVRGGAELTPASLVLRQGEQVELRLVNHEPQVVALGFRLRFDEGVVKIDAEAAPPGGLSADGSMIHLGVRRRPGVLEVPGVAVTGGRTFRPWDILYRFTVQGLRPGATTLTVEELTAVDLGDERRVVPVVPVRVDVRVP